MGNAAAHEPLGRATSALGVRTSVRSSHRRSKRRHGNPGSGPGTPGTPAGPAPTASEVRLLSSGTHLQVLAIRSLSGRGARDLSALHSRRGQNDVTVICFSSCAISLIWNSGKFNGICSILVSG